MATSITSRSIWAAAVVCGIVLAVPASAETVADRPSPPMLPAPLPEPVLPEVPQQILPPPDLWPTAPLNAPGAIGSAEMDPSGTIRLHLRAPTRSAPEQSVLPVVPRSAAAERLGYGEIELDRWDLHDGDMLRHLGGLRPGQIKPVPPWRAEEKWHCALDPDRGPCPLEHLLPGDTALR